ncbi:MAG: S8 family peptidase [Chitinophagaceae bacterium]
MKKFLLFLFLSLLASSSYSQSTRYIVRFKHKGATSFTLSNPAPYLSQRAIDRRTRYNITIDSADLPVPSSFITAIKNIPNVTVLNISRWLNAVTILTTDANAINTINSLPYVQNTMAIAARAVMNDMVKFEEEITPANPTNTRMQQVEGDYFDYGTASYNEIHIHNGDFLHNIGLRGQGMQIAMLDGGFFQYTNFKAFDSANANNQFLDTWDFVAGNASVVEDNSHGMSCLSTIAGNIPGQFIGTAPKANFRLYRTEDVAGEYPIEEFNWTCGAERADSSGADVISSSVGYNTFDNPAFDHTYSDMNGDITMAAIAADIAARKGVLIFNAAGNTGSTAWRYLVTPADADSVVAVGAVNTAGIVGSFSAYGPSSDGRIKPDVASVGVAALVQTSGNTIAASNGTSFACPKMAGLGAALWQAFPEFNNMRIVRALKEAGSIYSSPNDRIGYGIPNMKVAFTSLLVGFATSSSTINGCDVKVSWTSKDIRAMKYEIERKAPGETVYSKVGELNPQTGTILANHNYEFTNTLNNVAIGTIAYRIRQIVDTAAASFTAVYIDTTFITSALPCTGTNTVSITPNPPTGDNAILVVQNDDAVATLFIVVYDMKGNRTMQLLRSKAAGRAFFDLPITKLARGKYIVKVYNGKKEMGTTDLLKL